MQIIDYSYLADNYLSIIKHKFNDIETACIYLERGMPTDDNGCIGIKMPDGRVQLTQMYKDGSIDYMEHEWIEAYEIAITSEEAEATEEYDDGIASWCQFTGCVLPKVYA